MRHFKEILRRLRGSSEFDYGVATVSRIDKIIGLFCRILSLLLGSFVKESCNFIDPTDRSHPVTPCDTEYF